MNGESQPLRHAVAGEKSENVCPRCGGRFTCGRVAGQADCWCGTLPPLTIDPGVAGCLCPTCLTGLVERSRSGPA